jgi:hypothetical protein
MKQLSRTDKLIRIGTLSLIAGLALPLACSDDNVSDEPGVIDGAPVGGAGHGGHAGAVDGSPRGGRGGYGGYAGHVDGGCGGKCGAAGVSGHAGNQHTDGIILDRDAGAEDAGS